MKCSIIILAGGGSIRMGEDKGLMPFNGKPMIQHLIDRFIRIAPEIIIVTNNEKYKQFKCTLVQDNYPNHGPLSGIEAGLSISKNEQNIILSCDNPFIELSLIEYLSSQKTNYDILFTFFKTSNPFPGLYSKSIGSKLYMLINKGVRKVSALKDYYNVNELDCKAFNELNFINFNSPSDIKHWHENKH